MQVVAYDPHTATIRALPGAPEMPAADCGVNVDGRQFEGLHPEPALAK
jgi:hypothetical protein